MEEPGMDLVFEPRFEGASELKEALRLRPEIGRLARMKLGPQRPRYPIAVESRIRSTLERNRCRCPRQIRCLFLAILQANQF